MERGVRQGGVGTLSVGASITDLCAMLGYFSQKFGLEEDVSAAPLHPAAAIGALLLHSCYRIRSS